MRGYRPYVLIAAAALVAAASCSNVDGPVLPGDGDALYFPNGDGSRWTYRYRRYFNNVPSGDAFDYVRMFDGRVVVSGVECQRLRCGAAGVASYEIIFLADDEANYVRAYGREFYVGALMTGAVYFQPPWDFFVYPLRVNYTWAEAKQEDLSPLSLGLPEDLDNDGRKDTVDVEIINAVVVKEDLSLAIGTFTDCYKIRRTIYATYHMTAGGDAEEVYVQYNWFKEGKGVVQYSGDEITVPNATRYTFLAQLKDYYIAPAQKPTA